MRRRSFLLLLSLLCLSACAGSGEIAVPSQTVDVACGKCIFSMEEAKGCPWAAEIDGKPYLMLGPMPEDHLMHSPAGICNMRRQARVEGTIRQDRFVASSFELLPPENVPEKPTYTEEGVH